MALTRRKTSPHRSVLLLLLAVSLVLLASNGNLHCYAQGEAVADEATQEQIQTNQNLDHVADNKDAEHEGEDSAAQSDTEISSAESEHPEDEEPDEDESDEVDEILRSVVEEAQKAHDEDPTLHEEEEAFYKNAARERTSTSAEEGKKKKQEWSQPDSSFDPDNEDWGTYYDPQNIFCGKYDCYKILGFDYENFGSPPTSEITKRYRALSRVWHPDKSKHKNAKERFVKIARAYEVLTTRDVRKEYDELRYDIEKYWHKYGSSVLWQYAPKSDTTIVILMILILGNVFSWFSQKHRWKLVADRLVKAAVEDWSPSQGGSPESKQLREEAIAILQEREKEQESKDDAATANNGSNLATGSSKKQKGVKKLSGKEKKKQEMEALKPIIEQIVYAMDDFGGGFHKPTWRDLLIVSLARLPISLAKESLWFTKYWIRRLQKLELNEDERRVLTQRAVGPIAWETASEEEQEAMIKRELWVVANLAEWSEEQEFNKLSASEKKEYLRLKKKGLLPDKDKEE